MERWQGRVALVTGASSGLGAAIAKRLVEQGLNVVGFARRLERLKDLEKQLNGCKGKLFVFKGDVRKEEDVLSVFEWIEKTLGGVHVLINNAGTADNRRLTAGSCEDWKNVLETNVVGLSMCSREAVESMRAHNVQEGFIINMNSVLGHEVRAYTCPMYTASKFAVTALTQALGKELAADKSGIKVLSISPGLVESEMTNPWNTLTDPLVGAALAADDIADSVIRKLCAGRKVESISPGLVESEMTNPGNTLTDHLVGVALAEDDIADRVLHKLCAGRKVEVQEFTITGMSPNDFLKQMSPK